MLRPSLLALILLLIGCERPFIEPEAPTLEILEPADLGTVRVDPELPLAFRASSFRNVSRVEVNGAETTYLRDDDVYLDTLQLHVGLNTILVDAFDTEGTVGTDTVYAVHLPYGFANVGVQLPEPETLATLMKRRSAAEALRSSRMRTSCSAVFTGAAGTVMR